MDNKAHTALQVPWASKGNSLEGIKRSVVVNGERLPMPGPERFPAGAHSSTFFFTLVAGPRRSLSLKLSDKSVYEPHIRARLGTTEPPEPAFQIPLNSAKTRCMQGKSQPSPEKTCKVVGIRAVEGVKRSVVVNGERQPMPGPERFSAGPLPNEFGTNKTVKARFWTCLEPFFRQTS